MLKKITDLYQNLIKILFVSFILIILSTAYSAAADSEYIVKGDEISFSEARNIIKFTGNASFNSAELIIEADQFIVNTEAETIKGQGNILLSSPTNKIFGDSLEYDYKNERGTLYGAKTEIGELKISGKSLSILSVSPVEAAVTQAEFTPCDREDPHYHFKVKEIKIDADKKVSIYTIIPYIGSIPIFYLPYYSVNYDAKNGDDSLLNTIPVPVIGYAGSAGATVEFSYPYRINDKNRGKFYYWKSGDEEKNIDYEHSYKLSDQLDFKVKYNYLYQYDKEAGQIDDEEEKASLAFDYRSERLDFETGIYRDLLENDNENIYFIDTGYRFKSGINVRLSQEYNQEEKTAEKYFLSGNSWPINWNLKYVDGESYNYYPYLSLSYLAWDGFSPYTAFGRVENAGVELNKYRFGYNLSWDLKINSVFSYYIKHNYRIDYYKSSYDLDYHYSRLNTGFSFKNELTEKMIINSKLYYLDKSTGNYSPLPDDREDEEQLIRAALSLELKGDLPQSAWSLDSDGEYNLRTEEWDEITLRIRKKEDCFNAFVGYEFIDQSIVFGLEL